MPRFVDYCDDNQDLVICDGGSLDLLVVQIAKGLCRRSTFIAHDRDRVDIAEAILPEGFEVVEKTTPCKMDAESDWKRDPKKQEPAPESVAATPKTPASGVDLRTSFFIGNFEVGASLCYRDRDAVREEQED